MLTERHGEKMSNSSHSLTTDVLVIGTGIAGLFAAMRAKEMGADVLVVEQGESGFSGLSVGGTHRLRPVLPEDDFDEIMKAEVRENEYLVDQDFQESALRETWDRIQDLVSFGADFRRGDDGQIKMYYNDTLYPEYKQKNICWEPMGSYKHLLKVKTETIRRGVKILDKVLAVELLKSKGKIQGAAAFNLINGDFYLLKAKAVIIATGGFCGGGSVYQSLTGDGIAMALQAGAELRNMEFGKAETCGMPIRGAGPRWISRLLNPQEQEITVTNSKGEEFLEKYELGRRMEGRKPYGPPFRVELAAMFQEIKEGNGPCYIDFRAPDKESRMREFWGSYNDRLVTEVRLTGVSLDKIKYELGLVFGHCQAGGIKISPNGESSIAGLYAGGVATDLCGVMQYTVLSGMMGSMITGRRAGESAARYTNDQSEVMIDEEQLESVKREMFAPIEHKQGISADEIRLKAQKAWLNIDLRTQARLEKAMEEFQELRKEASDIVAQDYHELAKCHKIKNYLYCSEAVAAAALGRQETRLEHIRLDYPLTDNKEWLKWVIVHLEQDKIKSYLENLPMERWKYKPEPTVENRLRLKEGTSL